MQKVIKTILIMLALTPLLVDNLVFSPFVTGKTFFLRAVVVVASSLMLYGFFFIDSFRKVIMQKTKTIIKSPIFLALSSFVFISIISAVFAVDKYIAFWGDVTRAEGLVGLLFFFAIFLLTSLIFEKKDWLNFFKLNIVASFFVLMKEFAEYLSGLSRPNSFAGNPTFLAGYLLFSIFFAIIILKESKSKFWKYFGVIIIILSILGIFISQTRGTIVGLSFGFVSILIYTIFKYKNNLNTKKNIKKNFNYRKFAIIILSLILLSSLFFVSTRKNEIWQKVPGISRIANMTLEDSTMRTRLININIGIRAINPKENGVGKFLLGWGPDNFSIAYGKYFDKDQFDFERSWFDRAHNKVIDLMVMNGLLGLLSYLFIYVLLFVLILRDKEFSIINMCIIFILTAFFTHLLFVFDSVMTSVPFFAVLSFSLYLSLNKENKNTTDTNHNAIMNIALSSFAVILLLLIFVFFRGDLQSYIQMRQYSSIRKQGYSNYELKLNKVFYPFTVAQGEIRKNLMSFTKDNFDKNNVDMVNLSNIALEKGEDYLSRNKEDSRFLVFVANDYTFKGKKLNNKEYLLKGEEYYKQMLIEIPNRPDVVCGLAINLYYQGRYDESFLNFEKAFNLNENFYNNPKTKDDIENSYTYFMQYFYEKKDKDNFLKVVDRLKKNKYENVAMLDILIVFMEKYNRWPNIDFIQK